MNLYLTADQVGIQTGGGIVTSQEHAALSSLGFSRLLSRNELAAGVRLDSDPWGWDGHAFEIVQHHVAQQGSIYKLCHVYAGTFSKTVTFLRETGCKVSYTAAAHDIAISRREHIKLGIPYNYPHLTDPALFQRYVAGYLNADVLICPSQHSVNVMRGFGAKNRIEVLPHGVEIPKTIKPAPKSFVLGYLGSWGADKGIVYLLQAWKDLNYKDAVLLLAGRDSTSPFAMQLIQQFGGGNIRLMGWVNDVADFYNAISCYCQSSMSEGYGIEVLEAQAYGRPVICSTGAGAVDIVTNDLRFEAGDVARISHLIERVRILTPFQEPKQWQDNAEKYTWEKIRQRYIEVWKGLLA